MHEIAVLSHSVREALGTFGHKAKFDGDGDQRCEIPFIEILTLRSRSCAERSRRFLAQPVKKNGLDRATAQNDNAL